MPMMCKGRRWDSVFIPDNDPTTEIDDGTVAIDEEDEPTKNVKGTHVNSSGSSSEINGTCDHSNPHRSEVQLRRREVRPRPTPHTVTVHYSGHLNEGADDITGGRFRITGGVIDPDEGTWVATSAGDDFQDKKGREEKKEKEKEHRPYSS